MTYSVKEIFFTLQGEGAHAGRPAVFCRFSGCNLWTGREQDRTAAVCKFCDTDFVGINGTGGAKFGSAGELAEAILREWPQNTRIEDRFVVCTGGEPLLQLDDELVAALHDRGFTVAVETNGTQPVLDSIDWVCVSPKGTSQLVATRGNELKLVYPQVDAEPASFKDLAFDHFYLQPMDCADQQYNTELAVRYCMDNPQWKLSIQTHKLLGIR